MDRVLIYPGQIPLETDILRSERYTMTALGWLAQAMLGTGLVVDGLACTATSPASLSVNVGVGAIYEQEAVDSSAYSSLAADTTHSIVKQGLLSDPASFTFVAPTIAGQAQNFLVQAGYSDTDADSTVLPYYNASNPAVAYSGPGGNGTAQNTTREGLCVVSVKAGGAAASGTQATPTPDPGYVGLYVITVANGQIQITSGNITTLATAPFVPVKLPGVPGAVLDNVWSFGADTGAVNALAVTLSPAPTTYAAGMEVQVKAAHTNTGAATLNVNGLGAVAIVHKDGSALTAGDIVGGQVVIVVYDGANFQLQASAGANQFTIPYGVDAGAANALVANFNPAITAYTAGLLVQVKAAAANTGATTVNVNGLGAKTIKTSAGADLTAGAISAGQVVFLVFDGTNFQLGLTLSGLGNIIPYVADSGTVNALVAAFTPAVSSLTAGLAVLVKVANTNTGAATLNVNGLGAKTITRTGGAALQPGDLVVGEMALLAFDGTNFVPVNVTNIANSQLAQMPATTIKGNNAGSAEAPSDLTGAQVTSMLPAFGGDGGAGGSKGLVPAPSAGQGAAGYLLSASGGFVAPASSGVGVGQTWQNLTGSRAQLTSYQNTTGQPIMVMINAGAVPVELEASVDNSTWSGISAGEYYYSGHVTLIIPNNWYYKMSTSNGFSSWYELR